MSAEHPEVEGLIKRRIYKKTYDKINNLSIRINRWVFIKGTFPGWHRWLDAPREVNNLRNWHRHLFHYEINCHVRHNDRDIEFLQLKDKVEEYIAARFANSCFDMSCEDIAEELLREFNAYDVIVSEDGENGAELQCQYIPPGAK